MLILNFSFCIAHRFKPIYVALLGTSLPVIGVHHAFGDYERKGRRIFANLFGKRLSLLGVSDAQVEAVSFGKEKPAAQGGTEEVHAKNRRAELSYR